MVHNTCFEYSENVRMYSGTISKFSMSFFKIIGNFVYLLRKLTDENIAYVINENL